MTILTRKGPWFAALIGLAFVAHSGAGFTQQTLSETLADSDDQGRAALLEQIILDRMIVPGKGLSVAVIGNNTSSLGRSFGAPVKTSSKGIRNKQLFRHYSLDDGTQLIVSGEETIESLNFIGGPASSYMTSEGVTFGLQSGRIASVYGPGEITESELIYDELGIAFRFRNDALAEILIVEPGALNAEKDK